MDLHRFLVRRWKPDGWVEVLAEVLYLATSGTPLAALPHSLLRAAWPIQEIVCCTHAWRLIRIAIEVMDKDRTGFVDREVPQGILSNWWDQLPGALGVFGCFFSMEAPPKINGPDVLGDWHELVTPDQNRLEFLSDSLKSWARNHQWLNLY